MQKVGIKGPLERIQALRAAKEVSKQAARRSTEQGEQTGYTMKSSPQLDPIDSATSFQNINAESKGILGRHVVDITDKAVVTNDGKVSTSIEVFPHLRQEDDLGSAVRQMLAEFHASVEEKVAVLVQKYGGTKAGSLMEQQDSVTQGDKANNPKKRTRGYEDQCCQTGCSSKGPITQDARPQDPDTMINTKKPRADQGQASSLKSAPRGLFCDENPSRLDLSAVMSRLLEIGVDPLKQPPKAIDDGLKMVKPTYIYGNYPTYYSIRHKKQAKEDCRVKMFKKEWFNGRDCMDVGCHEGLVTLEMVSKFCSKTMIGLDIDVELVSRRAKKNLKAERVRVREAPNPANDQDLADWKTAALTSLKNTKFVVGDYGAGDATPSSFDTITCLSVSKWIHFHHGDDGMKFVFKKFFEALRPLGYLIFEPQEWSSYQQTRRKQDMSTVPFYSLKQLQFRPDKFLDYLLKDVGFHLEESLLIQESVKGFNRPIFVMQKPESKDC